MYSKEEFKALKIDFWTSLEALLKRHKNPHGSKVSWLNYNTKINQLYFRMEADEYGARLVIDIQMRDEGIRQLVWEQFDELQDKLHHLFGKRLVKYPTFQHSNGLTISRMAIEKDNCSILNKNDWPEMHEFLKDNFIKLDRFWMEYDEVFTNLMD